MFKFLMAHGMFLNSTINIHLWESFFYKCSPLRQKYFTRYGNWGSCFTYGAWFSLGGLASAGKTYNNCLAIRKGVEFLLKLQGDDGGWGESWLSCPKEVTYIYMPPFD